MNVHTTIATLIDRKLSAGAYPSFNALARAAGVNQPTLHRIYSGDSRDPSRENLERIAKFFNCSVDDLYSGNALSPSSDRQNPHIGASLQNETKVLEQHAHYAVRPESITIPQYDVAGAMGSSGLMLADQPGTITDWHVTPEWITKNVPHCTGVSNLCIVTGFGDSMRPLYNPGDPLLVDAGVRKIEADAVYFFRVGNEGYIKRIQRIPGKGYLVKSANPDYETWTLTPDMDVQVLGRVLMAWRSEKF